MRRLRQPLALGTATLLDHAIDLSSFDARFQNDAPAVPAYRPAMLLEVVRCAYAHGIVSSRGIEGACRERVTFIASPAIPQRTSRPSRRVSARCALAGH
jgi:transposase